MPADAYESPVVGHSEPDGIAAPASWPAAWSHLYGPIRDRAIFVALTMFLTGIGLALLGDPGAQWWAIALPLVLLIPSVLRPLRARSALQTAVGHRDASALSGRLLAASHGADGWLEPDSGDPTVPLSFRAARRTGARYAGEPVLLVWRHRHAALVFDGYDVLYLDHRPRGIRARRDELDVHDVPGRLAAP
ncbi:MAG TPA: hypothetical protein VHC49_08595 [Mycobacteriales bacterium]|nr:hypothetical protein [Mycobacteriales bacterium]